MIVVAVASAACSGGTPDLAPRFDGVLVDAVAVHAASGTLRILDTRSLAAHDAGHVPAALSYDVDAVAPTHLSRMDGLLRERLADALEPLGLEDGVPVVAVDEGSREGFARAAEACWHVALVSPNPCHVLEGGMDAWRAAGLDVSTERAPAPDGRPVSFTPRPLALADLELMRDAVYEGRRLIDVQDAIDEPSIPGAWRAPLSRMVDESGRVDRAAVAETARLAEFATGAKRIVFGWERRDGAAGWLLFGPHSDLRDARLFAGGMRQWWSRPELPRTDTVGDASLVGLR